MQKDFKGKEGSTFNQNNAERPKHSQLAVFKLEEKPSRNSSYHNEFKPFNIKKEALLSIGNKDHINTVSKENINAETTISEYQRRYDSLMEQTKGKEGIKSLYRKDLAISRKPKH